MEMCRIRGALAAVLTLVMFIASLRPRNAVAQTFEFLGTDGSCVILMSPQACTARSKTGEADETISLDSKKRCLRMGPVFEKLQRRRPQGKTLLSLNSQKTCFCSAETPRIRRWTWCHLKDDTLELQCTDPKTCERWTPYQNAYDGKQPSLCRHEKSGRVNQSWSELAPFVQAHCEN